MTKNLAGKIITTQESTSCLPNCSAEELAQSIVSLFAVPNRGYAFQGWEGACKSTIGPLCTLKQADNSEVNARFVKSKASKTPTKALLLLHDPDSNPTVWNEFVKHHFNNRCPIVYGGVIMGEDAFNITNNVYCYRIRFGYYDSLHTSESIGLPQTNLNLPAKNAIAHKDADHEIRAAVLGLLNRHPNLSLTLIAQSNTVSAVQSFLQTSTAERVGIAGLLVLEDPSHNHDSITELSPPELSHSEKTPLLKLRAHLKQKTKIGMALGQLTKSWWMAQ